MKPLSPCAVTVTTADGLRLPDPLTAADGTKINSSGEWEARRRSEILELFRAQVYGRAPVSRPADLRFETLETTPDVMDGAATRTRIKISYSGPGGAGAMHLVLFTPNHAPHSAPCFLLICNRRPPNLDPTLNWGNTFWPTEEIVSRGYATAAFFNGDVVPDQSDGFKSGVFAIYDSAPRPDDAWGAIAAWAWGAGRVMDFLETLPSIDHRRVALVGHSRGGKTALWAAAEDSRFAMVVSNNSGCTGAALARGKTGERIAKINRSFPHWFNANYKTWNEREDEMPFDQHMLLALIAPRLLYVASAAEDSWACPANEFLATVHAAPVYRLYGLAGLPATTMPGPDQPLLGEGIAYHLRPGGHDLTAGDWTRFMDFADQSWAAR